MSKAKMTLYPRVIRVLGSADGTGVFFHFAADADSRGKPDGEQIEVFVSDDAVDKIIETLRDHRARRRMGNTTRNVH